MVGGNLVYFIACFSSEEGMGPLHPPKTKKERSTAAVPLGSAHSISNEQAVWGREDDISPDVSKPCVFTWLVPSWWVLGGKGEWERRQTVQECLSSHSTNKTNLFGKLENYYF